MDRSLSMEEAASPSQVNDNHVAAAYPAGQKKKILCVNQQHRQHEGSSAPQQQQLMSSSPEREPYMELERRGSNESAARRRPSHSGSGFLGTMR
ncbi:uncharacterized protein TrAtP1_012271 [Trichoderma atroviride]|uniref:uncharacterized protein n=1 Tax=Hypocrea atroviridis TaxID=63577 RepID=UPI0033234442|nr:hypothetical protein TrAtP1_012271 [Trichoderma atroviride]